MFTTVKKRRDFLVAAESDKKFITHTFILKMVKRVETHPVPAGEVRVGFTVTKKMGNAVIRNRIKRRLREAVRFALGKYGVAGHDYVIISRHKALDCNFSELQRDMEFAFRKIINHKADNKMTRVRDGKKKSS